jgi:hypothetical protein
MSGINQVVQQLQIQRKRAEQELEKLNLALKALSSLDCSGTARSLGEDQGGTEAEVGLTETTKVVPCTPTV